MAETRVPDAIDALVQAFTAAGLKVWDGPVISGDFASAVFVGYDANPDGEFQAVIDHSQTWAGLGQRARKESFAIVCALVVLIGNEDTMSSARHAAYAMLTTVGDVIRVDPSLGQPPPFVASLRPNELYTEPTEHGMQVRIPFFIDVEISRV